MSIARAIKKSPKLCLVFFYRNSTDKNPPMSPATRGIYLCLSSSTQRLKAHKIVLKRNTKLPTNKPKLIESFPVNILSRCDGLLNILLIPNTADNPDFIR